ncbi:MAG: hypothetical protein NZ843_02255 [Fimbriimonadales bacterium]|nr:hypothetical protein [Fimbriimonadales bacterium]
MTQCVGIPLTLRRHIRSVGVLADDMTAFAKPIGKCLPLEIVQIWGDGIPAIVCDGTNAVAPTVPAETV